VHEPTLVHQIRFSQMMLLKNLEDITPEQSLVEPEGGGNSLNWVLGHICVARNRMIKILRGAGHLPEDALSMYQHADNYSRDTALGLGMLVTHHTAMQQQLIEGLCEIDQERFQAPYCHACHPLLFPDCPSGDARPCRGRHAFRG
jgi:hypothetical protein